MATPHLPWYNKVRDIVAPTEQAANVALIVIILFLLYILLKGSAGQKASAAVWAVLP